MIRAYRGKAPQIAPSAYIDPSAQVIGDVVIGEGSSVWCNSTIRGDVQYIRIGGAGSRPMANAAMRAATLGCRLRLS